MNKPRITIFDTTCRDGKQAAGNNHGPDDTVKIAQRLQALGVDVMEAGFAISSPLDFECVHRVATEVPGIIPCSLARAKTDDVTAAARALEGAITAPRIHTVIATSDIHLKYKLKLSREQVLEQAVQAVALACRYVDDVQFSAEDATRSDIEFLVTLTRAVIAAGARTVNLPDTVGYRMPHEMQQLIQAIHNRVPEIDEKNVVLSVHCHDDLGCAVSNTLAGVMGGARQVECTINGIGERAGNADLASVVMGLQTRSDVFGVTTGINTTELCNTAALVAGIVNKPIPDTWPVVGEHVFAHASGIHGDGAIKHSGTYEIMRPEDVGWNHEPFPLVSQSGRASLCFRLERLGYTVGDNALPGIYARFLELAAKVPVVEDSHLHQLMTSEPA